MRLPAGSRLGRYEITSYVGAGGMGEVYRARDTHLDKYVALKTIATAYADDPTSQPRFERERRLTASLEHPHICRLLDAGREAGVDYITMEFLEGESLADRLKRGALPVRTAIGCAIEIADALQYAHRAGVIHRDLKPANVFLTPTGVKVLDFGLAKLMARRSGEEVKVLDADTVPLDVTGRGSVIGSAQYMAPERLEGQEADHRTDVFGFGLLFYEMLTGRRAFEAAQPAALIAAILTADPAPMDLNHPKAGDLDWIVRRCVARAPDDRWQSMGDVEHVLKRIALPDATTDANARYRRNALAAALILTLLVVPAAWWVRQRWSSPIDAAEAPLVLTINPPPGGGFTPTQGSSQSAQLALSPDGRSVVFVASGPDGISRLWVRKLTSAVPESLPGTDNAVFPFWAPDSQSVGFFTADALRRLDLTGGPPRTLAPAKDGRGGTWGADNVILFSPDTSSPIFRVSANSGSPVGVTRFDTSRAENSHRWPQFLADGRHFVYVVRSHNEEYIGVYLTSLDGKAPRLVTNSSVGATFLPPKSLLYLEAGTLLAQTIDLSNHTMTGDRVQVAEQVASSSNNYGAFSASRTGAIAFASSAMSSELVWVDRAGRRLGIVAGPAEHVDFRLSPSGNALAVAQIERETNRSDIYVLDLVRPGARTRITATRSTDATPLWSPDGQRLAFRSNPGEAHDLYMTHSLGPGPATRFVSSDTGKYPTSWSTDGRYVAFHTRYSPEANWDVLYAEVTQPGEPQKFLESRFQEIQPQWSPDRKWVAYASDVSGRFEIWARPFPGPGDPQQVSVSGGTEPRWRADGTELFYISTGHQMSAVKVRPDGAKLEIGPSQELFAVPHRNVTPPFTYVYDVTSDGKRFLLRQPLEDVRSTPLTILVPRRPANSDAK